MASSSLDGSSFPVPYSNGQRGSYPGPGLDRPGSFRESLMVSGGPMASRSAAEIPAASQYLSLEQFATSDLKSVRTGELRRVLGVSVEEHSFGSSSSQSKPLPPISWEELKGFKVSVQEMALRARDRAKLLQESLLKLDRYRNLVSRKRQKNEFQSSEKAAGLNSLKIGSLMPPNPSDLLSQRQEERTKNAIPNKRVRSSVAEVQACLSYLPQSEGRIAASVRQGAIMDKDKTVFSDKDKGIPRVNNCSPLPCEDKVRGLPAGGDGWDNRKMKRGKRSGPPVGVRTAVGDHDFKQIMQQRSNNDPRPRSSDAIGFRTSSSNVVNGSNRMDINSQMSGGSSRVVPRNDLDTGSLAHERRDRTGGVDKERVISKGSNKLDIRDDAQLGSQSPLAKGKSSRAQKTGSAVMVSTPNFPRTSGSSDGWEQPSSVNKIQPSTGAANRKRPLPTTGSSSPPVQWASQRPLKISRSRRANVVSPVSNLDESQAPSEGFAAADVGPRLTGVDSSGVILSRGTANNTTQIKVKLDNVPSPPGLSESEESGAPEIKCKEKEIDNIGIENGTSNVTPKASTFVFPTKKNKLPPKEEIGDGVRRQGRTGRGSVQSKAFLSVTKEKMENVETTKLPKNGKPVSDKTESRIGRPPSKKVSDRKGCIRPVQTINSGSSALAVEPEDDLEELLAAANAARTASSLASSTPFWKKMESMFSCVTSKDLAYLKHQINFSEELDGNLCDLLGTDQSEMSEVTCQAVPYSDICLQESQTNAVGTLHAVDESYLVKTTYGKIERGICSGKAIPLSQRLLSAIITEDEIEDFDSSMKGDAIVQFSSVCSPFGRESQIQNELNSAFDADHDLKSQTNCCGDNILCNDCATANCFRSPSNFMSCDNISPENDAHIHPDTGAASYFGQSNRNRGEASTTGSSGAFYECQFEHMSLDDRILMELHSIGIYPDTVPDLAAEEDVEEIEKVISELKIKLYQQVREKKSNLSKLEKAMQEGKEYERRDLEQHAMNKLVEMANKRLLGGRGTSSHKGGASKVSKQLSLAFTKRTLARCHKFEKTGQSCFSEPVLRDCLFSEPLRSGDAKEADGIKSCTAADMYAESHNCQLPSRVSASVVSSVVFERHGSGKIDRGPVDSFQGPTEQTFAKTDSVSNRGKKREVLLDKVVSNSVSRATSTVNNTLPGGAKWKKTDKDSEKDALSRNSTQKTGRLSLSTGRGERKTKAKPKQKIAQLSNSGNGLGRVTETTTFVLPSREESCETMSGGSKKVKQELELQSSRNNAQELSEETEDNIFTNLPLQRIDSIDELDVADGLGGQGQDIASWLNVDEEALEDADLDCLQIPMDDLADLNMNF